MAAKMGKSAGLAASAGPQTWLLLPELLPGSVTSPKEKSCSHLCRFMHTLSFPVLSKTWLLLGLAVVQTSGLSLLP